MSAPALLTTADIHAVIDALTERQREVLGLIAMNQDIGHHPRTTEALMRRGLIEEFEQEIRERGKLPLIVKRYELPIRIHIAWCEWCVIHHPDEDGV